MEHRLGIIAGSLLVSAVIANGQGSTEELKRELELLRSDYQSRIERLEARIRELEEGERRPATRRSNWSATAEEMDAAMKREEEAAAKLESVKRSVDKSFEENTETRDIARNRDAERMLAERVEDVLEGYMDISGYFRAGYGRSGSGGRSGHSGFPEWRNTGWAMRRKTMARWRLRKPSIRPGFLAGARVAE